MLDCADPFEYCPREVAVHMSSYHFDRSAGYNENNAGLGLKWRKHGTRLFITVGAFRNSLDHTSSYSGVGGDWRIAGPVKVRVTTGVVTGYEFSPAPFVFPELLIGERSGVALGYSPRIEVGEHLIDSFVSLTLFQRF
jgi:hypothetical protein